MSIVIPRLKDGGLNVFEHEPNIILFKLTEIEFSHQICIMQNKQTNKQETNKQTNKERNKQTNTFSLNRQAGHAAYQISSDSIKKFASKMGFEISAFSL